MQSASPHFPRGISGMALRDPPNLSFLFRVGGGNEVVRSRLDLAGALGWVGLPSPSGKRGGGSIWFGGGPFLATTDKRSFMPLKGSLLLLIFSPLGFLPTPFLFANSCFSTHSFIPLFSEVCSAHRKLLLSGMGNAEVGLLWRECISIPTNLVLNHPDPWLPGRIARLETRLLPSSGGCGLSLPAWSVSFRCPVD